MSQQKKVSFGSKMRYKFDNFMASGPKSIFYALIILFIVAFLLTGIIRIGTDFIVIKAFEKTEQQSPEAQAPAPAEPEKAEKEPTGTEKLFKDGWTTFMQITDPGAVAEDSDSPKLMKVVGILTMFLGLIFFSAVIAFITTQLDEKINSLKKGKSDVIETGHVLILGWGDIVIEIIKELTIANESEKDAAVVVMSETPKEEMDDYLNDHLPERKTTRVITRTGRISSMDSLRRVGLETCRSVVILPLCSESATEEEKLISDAKVLKTILAVVAASRQDGTGPEIIAEIYDDTKKKVMADLDPEKITMVDSGCMIAKIIVQTSRTSGLAYVYDSMIGFQGSEIYYYNTDWNGCKFGELKFRFPDGVPFGVKPKGEKIQLNPPADYSLKSDDEIIIIAEDDSTIKLSKTPVFKAEILPLRDRKLEKTIEKELIIGWNAKAITIIEEYVDYILPGSVIDVLLSDDAKDESVEIIKTLQSKYSDIKIEILFMNPLEIDDLRKAGLEKYDNVIILNHTEDDAEKVDATTITTLLLIKTLFKEVGAKTGKKVMTQLITEVMNSENLELVTKTGVNDSIISYQMVSKILAQVALNPDVLHVYDDLFSEEGSEIYLKPVDLYLEKLPEQVKVIDLMDIAQRRNEVMLGYRFIEQENNVDSHFGVQINMKKDQVIKIKPGDQLIVLAENEC